jgi:hypothetical protein
MPYLQFLGFVIPCSKLPEMTFRRNIRGHFPGEIRLPRNYFFHHFRFFSLSIAFKTFSWVANEENRK